LPNHKTHDAITVVTGIALVPITYLTLQYFEVSNENVVSDIALLTGAHLLSGIMFSPDLDIDSEIDNRWGPFYWIWRPYMWAVPHGSLLWSHGLVIPPLLRLVYFFVVGTLVFLAVAWVLGGVGIILPDYPLRAISYLQQLAHTRPHQVEAFLIGFITGGAAHSIADWLITYHTDRHEHHRHYRQHHYRH
jgi:uncharacterized metal-binding protein